LLAVEHNEIVGALNAAPWPHCQMTLSDKLRSAPAMVHAAGSALPRMMRMASARAKHDPREPHWHIGPLGVRPENQGRGVGRALLASFLDTVDHRLEAAFLETDVNRNVVLYERFGFVVTEREEILGVDTHFMWRASRL
jgi:ribosomal protein S18 acetylase RimI-like enzyme